MISLLTATRLELIKTYSRYRTYIGFVTISILVPLIMWLVRKYGFDEMQGNTLNSLENSFVFVGSLVNGLLISYYLMTVLWVHFPFFIVLVGGDIVASESSAGTFRLWLSRPVSRFTVLTSKFLATFIYTSSIVFFLGLCSVGCGILIIGGGDLLVFDKGILILSQEEALLRFLLAYSLAVCVQMVVASLSFLFSTMSNNSVGPIIGTYAIIVVSLILSVLRIDALDGIRPYLFTSYFDVFFAPFADPIPWEEIKFNLSRLGIFIAVFYSLSLISFLRKDICT